MAAAERFRKNPDTPGPRVCGCKSHVIVHLRQRCRARDIVVCEVRADSHVGDAMVAKSNTFQVYLDQDERPENASKALIVVLPGGASLLGHAGAPRGTAASWRGFAFAPNSYPDRPPLSKSCYGLRSCMESATCSANRYCSMRTVGVVRSQCASWLPLNRGLEELNVEAAD